MIVNPLSAAAGSCSHHNNQSNNPDPKQDPWTRAHYDDFIKRTEKSVGLKGQPRAVIFHEKYGREHAHVAWSRINDRALKAVHISHDKQKLRTICREFARDYGI